MRKNNIDHDPPAFERRPAFVTAALHHGAPALATGERRDMMADAERWNIS
jgi:hypothetical protein